MPTTADGALAFVALLAAASFVTGVVAAAIKVAVTRRTTRKDTRHV